MYSLTFTEYRILCYSVLCESYSLNNAHPVQELEGGPPAPWKLHEEEGDTLLTLTREYENEHIQVFVSAEDQVRRIGGI